MKDVESSVRGKGWVEIDIGIMWLLTYSRDHVPRSCDQVLWPDLYKIINKWDNNRATNSFAYNKNTLVDKNLKKPKLSKQKFGQPYIQKTKKSFEII